MALSGKICLVTGASKGIGRGIAVQLGGAGATVYITGRSADKLQECATEIKNRGGQAIAVSVDHSKDNEVEQLFERINRENNGRLDVLVNNAYAGVDMISKNSGKKFYVANPSDQWDCINGVGLRNHFLCTVYASRLMVERKDGLIVNVSSPGGLKYLFNVAYGIGKSAVDRMAADCAVELRKDKVAMISLWPGPVKTEYIQDNVLNAEKDDGPKLAAAAVFANAESVEFAGKAVAHLAADAKKMDKTGKIVLTCDLAKEYGFVDEDGSVHDIRSVSRLLASTGHTWMAAVTPGFVRMPLFLMHYGSYKF